MSRRSSCARSHHASDFLIGISAARVACAAQRLLACGQLAVLASGDVPFIAGDPAKHPDGISCRHQSYCFGGPCVMRVLRSGVSGRGEGDDRAVDDDAAGGERGALRGPAEPGDLSMVGEVLDVRRVAPPGANKARRAGNPKPRRCCCPAPGGHAGRNTREVIRGGRRPEVWSIANSAGWRMPPQHEGGKNQAATDQASRDRRRAQAWP